MSKAFTKLCLLVAAIALPLHAASDVLIPTTCTREVNEQLAKLIRQHPKGPVDNVMLCGISASASRTQKGGPHGDHQVITVQVNIPDLDNPSVEVVSNDALDGKVKAAKGVRIFAYGQAYFDIPPEKAGSIVAGLHDVHCSTHAGADNGWVVVGTRKYPAASCGDLQPTPEPPMLSISAAPIRMAPSAEPSPMLKAGHPVDWFFVFKFNAKSFPGCGGTAPSGCLFGGERKTYPQGSGQQFVYATNEAPSLQKGDGCIGSSATDPVGATFDAVYHGSFHYVIWNDQFKNSPDILHCGEGCESPWGHSKGVVAWNDKGAGMLMQVSTPSWPASGSSFSPRTGDGNTLGCVTDNDVLVSQHFFAVRLTRADVLAVLDALNNSSVATDPHTPQLVSNGGPAEIQAKVARLGIKSPSKQIQDVTLSTGVRLISKPSGLAVPPWQMVSSVLGGVPLRAATWWLHPAIPSTTATTGVGCWDSHLEKAGAVENALSGSWMGVPFKLTGGLSTDANHAKIGVSMPAGDIAIFGDLNQQGSLDPPTCSSSQNARGGMFFVLRNQTLADGMRNLIADSTQLAAVHQ